MLRIYFLQQWFDLSVPAAEDAIYDSESMRRFAGAELGEDKIPGETTILRFRHLLEEHDLTKAIFEKIGSLLEERGLFLKQGTIVDATIIHAPSATKNASGSRDPDMRQTKEGNTWYFEMKAHVGTDKWGTVHSLVTANAAEADINPLPDLMHGEERELYEGREYWCESVQQAFQEVGVRYRVNRRRTSKNPMSDYWKDLNRSRARVDLRSGARARARSGGGGSRAGITAAQSFPRPV